MKNKKAPILKRNNTIGTSLVDSYCDRILRLFGFEFVRLKVYARREDYWRHREHGWELTVYCVEKGFVIKFDRAPIPKNADFARHLVADGLFKWRSGILTTNSKCSLEDILQVVFRYLPSDEIVRILKSLNTWERDCADREIAAMELEEVSDTDPLDS